MTRWIQKTAWALALYLTLSAVSSCRPAPATIESEVSDPSPDVCAGVLLDVIASGDRVTLRLVRAGELYAVDFVSGELEDGGDLVTGGAPMVELRDVQVCATGTLEGDACLEAVWASGACWEVRR